MIERRVAAFVIAAAHVAIACHLLAALHFGRRHRGIRQTGKERRGCPEANEKQRHGATYDHKTNLKPEQQTGQGVQPLAQQQRSLTEPTPAKRESANCLV
jgi:hypothetical protein